MSERMRRGLIFIGLVLLPFIVGPLFTYEIIKIDIPTDMADQPSFTYQEGPRLLPPEKSVPTSGKSIVLDTLPINPIAADETSIQRGEILYSIYCTLCHGDTGQGNGPLAEHYEERPLRSLSSGSVTAQFDGQLFQTISEGFSRMPAQAEALSPRERWDVINYVRTLAE
ncbi:MAG: cytochrome c [Candidatus Promineifilaceae bacterium]|nr:cytochrome c [Candidatus Promineifilaceae bacterium]